MTNSDIPAGPPGMTHNENRRRFEAHIADAPVAYLSYTREGDRAVLEHTFVPNELRGRGIAAKLARAALEEARQRRWKVVPRCSYVAAFIKRNPEFAGLLHGELQR